LMILCIVQVNRWQSSDAGVANSTAIHVLVANVNCSSVAVSVPPVPMVPFGALVATPRMTGARVTVGP